MVIPGNITIKEFENVVAGYCESEFALTVCNATIGIMGTFYALGLSNKEIITTPLTWPGALSGLITLKCKMKFCDVETETLTIDPEGLESSINTNTAAVFTADFLGYPANLDKIKPICSKHNLLLIHDASSSFGSKYKKKYSGHYADVTILSFGAKKLFTTGEGGCIITNKKNIYEKLSLFLAHPERQSIELESINPFPLNTRINPMAAEYGLKTFRTQIDNIALNQTKVETWFKENGLKLLSNSAKPNYYKVLINPEQKIALSKRNDVLLGNFPFNKLIYQEPYFIKIYGNHWGPCMKAESALSNYSIFQTTLIKNDFNN